MGVEITNIMRSASKRIIERNLDANSHQLAFACEADREEAEEIAAEEIARLGATRPTPSDAGGVEARIAAVRADRDAWIARFDAVTNIVQSWIYRTGDARGCEDFCDGWRNGIVSVVRDALGKAREVDRTYDQRRIDAEARARSTQPAGVTAGEETDHG